MMEERDIQMEDPFAFLTLNFLKKSEIFPGSLGTFRYRFQRTGKVNDGSIQAWVYENICFAVGIKLICLVLGAFGIANMWMAIFADVGVMVIAVLNAIRALFVKRL